MLSLLAVHTQTLPLLVVVELMKNDLRSHLRQHRTLDPTVPRLTRKRLTEMVCWI